MIYSVGPDEKSDFYELWQQGKQLKIMEMSEAEEICICYYKLAYATKTKQSITSQKPGSWDFRQIANSVLNKGKFAFQWPRVVVSCFW